MVSETIVAQTTPSGFGGVGIVRISGDLVPTIAQHLLKTLPNHKEAHYLPFLNCHGETLDEGIALYFKAPHSFTGEHVLELQGHGSPVAIQRLINEAITLGARMARPGEFSERAYLNNKIDLLQAEAILDLIHANSEQAARSAIRSLQGEFSEEIYRCLEQLIHLRMHIESQIDFPDEEIESLTYPKIMSLFEELEKKLQNIFKKAKTGTLLVEGAKVVILGRANAGKSSLLNALSGYDAAIVTDIPGTTRDLLKESIQLDGLVLHLTDTAGLRESEDVVEQEGIKRAKNELKKCDHIIFVVDGTTTKETNPFNLFPEIQHEVSNALPITVLYNKIDALNRLPKIEKKENYTVIDVSITNNLGLDLLKEHLKKSFQHSTLSEGTFAARGRHLSALERCQEHVLLAKNAFSKTFTLELTAEDLRLAQKCLDEITGQFTSDDLLSKIFSEFCIGK